MNTMMKRICSCHMFWEFLGCRAFTCMSIGEAARGGHCGCDGFGMNGYEQKCKKCGQQIE